MRTQKILKMMKKIYKNEPKICKNLYKKTLKNA